MSQRFQRGDIVLIHFPFTDLSGSKRRPAIVLGEYPPDVIVAFISSVIPSPLEPSDVLLQPALSSGLKKPSVLRLHKLATLEQGLITRRLGRLDYPLLVAADRALIASLGIDPHSILQAEYRKLAALLANDGETAVLDAIRSQA